MKTRQTVVAIMLVTGAMVVAWFGFFFYRDNFSTHFPIKSISADVYRAWEIPYWNFFDGGGQPLAGNPNTLTFYPDNILYLVLPAHVAFNLHFLLHLAAAYAAMRALTRSHFGGALYALSGLAISATAFYNLIVAVAAIPLAFLALDRRRPLLLGASFGLLALGGEPVTIAATLLAVAILAVKRSSFRELLIAGAVAAVIGSPQLVAYTDIAGEVERVAGMSVRTVLNASLHPIRIVEIAFGPILGVLNDPGGEHRARLFSTIFLGLIALPALMRRSRYTVIVAVMLFFALGRYNPLVAAAVEAMPSIRIVRFPEKFAMPMIAALVVLASEFYRTARWKRAWLVITFVPLLLSGWRALPIDFYAPYRVGPVSARRIRGESVVAAGVMPARQEYRLRARALEPLFGATAGVRYAITPSPDGMHSLRSRMVVERYSVAPDDLRSKYLRIAGCDVPRALAAAYFPQNLISGRNIYEEAAIVENPRFDEQRDAAVGRPLFDPARARVTAYAERGQSIDVTVQADGPAVLVVNQTYFSAWRANAGQLDTLPVNIDRLGVLVPAGRTNIVLRFGRNRFAVAAAWIASTLALLLIAGAELIEKLHRRTGEVERAGDDDGAAR